MLCHRNGFPKSHQLGISVESRFLPWRYQPFSDARKNCFQSNLSSGLRYETRTADMWIN